MATLIIPHLEDDVVNTLKARAELDHRLLEAEVRELLRDVAAGGSPEFPARAGGSDRGAEADVPQPDSTELVREDRGRSRSPSA
ncbi:MAG: FitA-like ribbon-helix-helix domain-containing protein [Geminicoccaceae bacterium]